MDSQQQSVLNDDRVGRLLLKLSLPAFMGLFVMTLYNVVDTIFISRYVGSLGIAGLSISFPIQMMIMGLGQMIGIGRASVISRALGANDPRKAERTLGNAISHSIIISILIAAVGLANIDPLLRLMGASEAVLLYAKDYMFIIFAGTTVQFFAMVLSSTIRAQGNAHVPMMSMTIGAGINIGLDALFIISFGMGIKGAALATIIGQTISTLYLFRYYSSGKSSLKIYPGNLRVEMNIARDIFTIGIASFAQIAATSVSAVFVNRVLGTYGGDMAISAYGIINRVIMFALMPGIVIGQGLQPILGFNYGARRYDRVLKSIKIASIAATICCIAAFIVLNFFPEPIIKIFTADLLLIESSSHATGYVFRAAYLLGITMLGSLVFQSIGKATQSMVTSLVRPLFLIPLIFILPKLWQVDGVWLSFPISDAIAFTLTMVLLIRQIREFKSSDSLKAVESLQVGS